MVKGKLYLHFGHHIPSYISLHYTTCILSFKCLHDDGMYKAMGKCDKLVSEELQRSLVGCPKVAEAELAGHEKLNMLSSLTTQAYTLHNSHCSVSIVTID